MPLLRYYNPANPKQQYQTISASDPNIPAGYLDTQGSDGATPEALKGFVGGRSSGGFPAYGPTDGTAASGIWPNGILNGYAGGKATG